jgi:hypothetical protein
VLQHVCFLVHVSLVYKSFDGLCHSVLLPLLSCRGAMRNRWLVLVVVHLHSPSGDVFVAYTCVHADCVHVTLCIEGGLAHGSVLIDGATCLEQCAHPSAQVVLGMGSVADGLESDSTSSRQRRGGCRQWQSQRPVSKAKSCLHSPFRLNRRLWAWTL